MTQPTSLDRFTAAIVGTGDEFYGVTLHHESGTATVHLGED